MESELMCVWVRVWVRAHTRVPLGETNKGQSAKEEGSVQSG